MSSLGPPAAIKKAKQRKRRKPSGDVRAAGSSGKPSQPSEGQVSEPKALGLAEVLHSSQAASRKRKKSKAAPHVAPAAAAMATAGAASDEDHAPLSNGHSSAEAVNAQLATAAPLTSFDPTEVAAAADQGAPAAAVEAALGVSTAPTNVATASAATAMDDPPSKKVSRCHFLDFFGLRDCTDAQTTGSSGPAA
ncbi:hypothetical protein WJX74_008433 [Apatococcus lobatus]|uniref:Uncharacterized protein n=1 Tax=Apatococcus lobatus TaxID=904363 RepID=A0AAW1QVP3_9CHLO